MAQGSIPRASVQEWVHEPATRDAARVATIDDIARAAGVSIAAVSLVMNGHPVVREDTRRRVLEAVARLNYLPSSLGRSLWRPRHAPTLLLAADTPTDR